MPVNSPMPLENRPAQADAPKRKGFRPDNARRPAAVAPQGSQSAYIFPNWFLLFETTLKTMGLRGASRQPQSPLLPPYPAWGPHCPVVATAPQLGHGLPNVVLNVPPNEPSPTSLKPASGYARMFGRFPIILSVAK